MIALSFSIVWSVSVYLAYLVFMNPYWITKENKPIAILSGLMPLLLCLLWIIIDV